jgi:hypothetical protein
MSTTASKTLSAPQRQQFVLPNSQHMDRAQVRRAAQVRIDRRPAPPAVVAGARRAILARLPIQPRLTVGAANDRYEQEADRIAAQVMVPMVAGVAPVQRQEDDEEEIQAKPLAATITPLVQRQEEDEEAETIQASAPAPGRAGFDPGSDFEAQLHRQQHGGQPLPFDLRSFMEQRFGADFGKVRVHTDAGAAHLSRTIQAQAFTHDRDIYFGADRYNPTTPAGQELLAHELTHTIQQGASPVQPTAPTSAAPGAPPVQAAFVNAIVIDTAHAHELPVVGQGNNQTHKAGSSRGDKLKKEAIVQAEDDLNTYITTNDGQRWAPVTPQSVHGPQNKALYVRTSKLVFPTALHHEQQRHQDTTHALEHLEEDEPKKLEELKEITENAGLTTYQANQGLQQPDIKQTPKIEQAELGLTVGTGGLDAVTGLFDLAHRAHEIAKNGAAWDKYASGVGVFVYEGVESMTQTAYGVTGLINNLPKVWGGEGGLGKSELAEKALLPISEGLSSIKNTVLGLIKLFKAYKAKKGRDAALALHQLTQAALSGAKTAKDTYTLIGRTIPPMLTHVIPPISIAVSAIHLLIRLPDTFQAGELKETMHGKGKDWRQQIETALGKPKKSPDVFDKDRRGVFPRWKTYYRTKPAVRNALAALALAMRNGEGAIQHAQPEHHNRQQQRTQAEHEFDVANQQWTQANQLLQNRREAEQQARTALNTFDQKREQRRVASVEVQERETRANTANREWQMARQEHEETQVQTKLADQKQIEVKKRFVEANQKLQKLQAPRQQRTSQTDQESPPQQESQPSEEALQLANQEFLTTQQELQEAIVQCGMRRKAFLQAVVRYEEAERTLQEAQLQHEKARGTLHTAQNDVRQLLPQNQDNEETHRLQLEQRVNESAEATQQATLQVENARQVREQKDQALQLARQQADQARQNHEDAYTPIHQALGVLGAWQFAQNTPLKLTLRMVKQAVEQHNPPADAQPDFAPVYGLDDLVAHYEFADKMREINLKRQVVGWTDIVLDLTSMAGDITTIAVGATGLGAAIGQGLKGVSAGYKAGHSTAKFIEKLYRNRGEGEHKKSTLNKHREYVNHARFIYNQLAALDPQQPNVATKVQELLALVRATGVNVPLWLAEQDVSRQVTMLVEAMKQR